MLLGLHLRVRSLRKYYQTRSGTQSEVEVTNRVGLHLDEGGDTSGTGFLIDKDRGWIITNAHVATRSPASIEISFKGQPAVSAKRIHIDPVIDLAILQVEDSKIPENAIAASLACADLPRSGAAVLAYGHPMGFKFTGSRGIVSGYTDKYPPSHYLMTDAQIDNGSSGGPLIRVSDGMVVGSIPLLFKMKTYPSASLNLHRRSV